MEGRKEDKKKEENRREKRDDKEEMIGLEMKKSMSEY